MNKDEFNKNVFSSKPTAVERNEYTLDGYGDTFGYYDMVIKDFKMMGDKYLFDIKIIMNKSDKLVGLVHNAQNPTKEEYEEFKKAYISLYGQPVKVNNIEKDNELESIWQFENTQTSLHYFYLHSIDKHIFRIKHTPITTLKNNNSSSSSTATNSSSRTYHLGPRGGCYYLNSSGNKVYVDRSLCKLKPNKS